MKKILNKKGYIIAPMIIITTFIAGFILGLFVGQYMPIGWLFPCNYAGDIFLDFITSIVFDDLKPEVQKALLNFLEVTEDEINKDIYIVTL